MVARNNAPTESETFRVTRDLDASRDTVWKAFTEKDQLFQWWGPKGYKIVECTLDVRPGGIFHYGMRGPGEAEMWGKWVFQEVDEPARLVFVNSFSDKDANVVRHPMAEGWPLEMLVTVSFEDMGEKTRMTQTAVAYNASEAEREVFKAGFDSMNGGFNATFDQLDEHLAKLAGGAA